jgi:adenosylmethionine-8-amino-7-oxononanoate aminotransferase
MIFFPVRRADRVKHQGSEAMEAAMKLARQYHLGLSSKSPRVKFIARRCSWHGCTLATLSLGDFKARKTVFESLYQGGNVSHVSPCHPYRDLGKGERPEDYIDRLKQELEEEFQRIGPGNVAAFVVEPMVGTVSATVPICIKSSRQEH